MAEISRFWTTNGVGDGPSTEYTSNNFSDFCAAVFSYGVLKRVDSELVCSIAANGKDINLHSGAAIVAGRFYRNDSLLVLSFTPPLIGNTGFRVVLRSDWAKNTTRAYVKTSTGGNPEPPGVTQNYGVAWEITLCTGLIVGANSITIYDVKDWAEFSTTLDDNSIVGNMIAPNAITTPKLDGGAVTTEKIPDINITEPKLGNLSVGDEKIENGTFINLPASHAKFADGSLIGKLIFSDESVLWQKLGGGTFKMFMRQGGSPTDWITPGTVAYYTEDKLEMQVGSALYQFGDSWTTATARITFPHAYMSGIPIVFSTIEASGSGEGYTVRAQIKWVTKSEAYFVLSRNGPVNQSTSGYLYWWAIGGALY